MSCQGESSGDGKGGAENGSTSNENPKKGLDSVRQKFFEDTLKHIDEMFISEEGKKKLEGLNAKFAPVPRGRGGGGRRGGYRGRGRGAAKK